MGGGRPLGMGGRSAAALAAASTKVQKGLLVDIAGRGVMEGVEEGMRWGMG